MVGALYEGEGRAFTFMLPDEPAVPVPLETVCMSQDEWQTFLRQVDLLETEVTVRSADGTVGKAIVRKSQRQVDQVVQWTVFRRDSYACRYCGADKVPLTVDHLVLWEDGGPSTVENMVTACRKCNKVRGSVPYADWLRHPYYVDKAVRLPASVRDANVAVADTLGKIPVVKNVRSR